MNKCASYTSIVLIIATLSGCGVAVKTIAAKSASERTGVFEEVTDGTAIPGGYGDVLIMASIKTHLEDFYALESKSSAHGKESYPFLINIEGQAALWRAAGKKHGLPKCVDGKTSGDPEAGEGMKYVLNKNIRLAAGTHTVFFGLPEESYYTAADIAVKSGESYLLEFKPNYKYKITPTRIPTFLKGIDSYEALMSERTLQ